MTTSGSYSFAPSLGELTIYAFNVAGVRPTAILQEHMQSARMATNLMLASWANQGVNLWEVELVTVPLVQGTATYNVDPKVVVILDAYMRIDDGSAPPTDRIILPISRSEYSSYSQKTTQGFTTVYWMDRLISPTVTLWPVPDGTSAQYLMYYAVTQIQDANFTSGQNVDIPYRWYEAFADGLAYRLSKIWSPDKAAVLKAVADETYKIAAYQDEEVASQFISPQISSYYRP